MTTPPRKRIYQWYQNKDRLSSATPYLIKLLIVHCVLKVINKGHAENDNASSKKHGTLSPPTMVLFFMLMTSIYQDRTHCFNVDVSSISLWLWLSVLLVFVVFHLIRVAVPASSVVRLWPAFITMECRMMNKGLKFGHVNRWFSSL